MNWGKEVSARASALLPDRVLRSRMRPGYLIVGTKRGGTTALAAWVSEHPQVAPCKSKKGTHYFDINYWRGPKWYFSRFEQRRGDWRITGEASPYYMYHPAGADRIAATLPDVKLVATLRDPVERAWSEYCYQVSRGIETESFDRALDLQSERIEGERDRLLADPRFPGMNYRHFGYLERGHYAEQLERLYAKFARSQVLLLKSEDMVCDPGRQLSLVWQFLELEQVQLSGLPTYEELLTRKKSEPNREASRPKPTLPPATRERLHEYYRPWNLRLYRLTGIDFGWDLRRVS